MVLRLSGADTFMDCCKKKKISLFFFVKLHYDKNGRAEQDITETPLREGDFAYDFKSDFAEYVGRIERDHQSEFLYL